MIEIDEISIKLYSESDYSFDSVDNVRHYDRFGFGVDSDKRNAHTIIGVRCAVTGTNILLVSAGFSGSPNPNSYISNQDDLLICVGSDVFCLNIFDLGVKWSISCDDSSCFALYRIGKDFLVHGEQYITSINSQGSIRWQFCGADIFVLPNGGEVFTINSGLISIVDWQENKYELDYDGNNIKKDGVT